MEVYASRIINEFLFGSRIHYVNILWAQYLVPQHIADNSLHLTPNLTLMEFIIQVAGI